MKQLIIRKGDKGDAKDFARLYLIATRGLYHTLIGPRVTYVLENIYRHPGTILSYTNAHFIESQGRTAGLVMLNTRQEQARHQSGDYTRGTLKLMRLVLRYMHVHLIGRASHLLTSGEISAFQYNAGDLYLQALAITPEFRGRGLGGELLGFVNQTAVKAGCHRIVLACEIDNQKAVRFYLNHGYETNLQSPAFHVRGVTFRFYQMTTNPTN